MQLTRFDHARRLLALGLVAVLALGGCGKRTNYNSGYGNGFVTYNANGTFDFQDDAKGAGQGRWMVSGSQFCEAFGAGAATKCGVFKSTGDAYFAADSRLVEMKV